MVEQGFYVVVGRSAGAEAAKTGGEAGVPVGDGEAVSLADEAFVEEGEMGAIGGRGILGSGDGVEAAGAAGQFADGEGEFVPAELAFVAIMIETGNKGRKSDDMEDGGGEVGGVGRRSDLVVDDIDGGTFFHQPDHGLYKVVTEFGIYPGSADDEGTIGIMLQGLVFAFELGGAVGVDGASGVFLF